jgi:hypothetical protein
MEQVELNVQTPGEPAAVHISMDQSVGHMPMEQVAVHMQELVVVRMTMVQVAVQKWVVATAADIGYRKVATAVHNFVAAGTIDHNHLL